MLVFPQNSRTLIVANQEFSKLCFIQTDCGNLKMDNQDRITNATGSVQNWELEQPVAADGAWCMGAEIYAYICVDMSKFSFGASVVAVRPIVTVVAIVGVFACAV
ncbi:hypothetical protein Nepgr_021711 [Nepenthes gracilis]|uniref:Uncharacterized protein n=1 Tax=Nepenthes gracilis TaxID=150966 RepID=A0AAD3SZ88_NEPGR|nr:hypothetical protein Nepgr_021711 [Nepenthes gracilis]